MDSIPSNGNGDFVAHITAAGGKVRGLAALTTRAVEEARARHGLAPTAAAALGRALTACAMLGAGLKGNQKVMVEVAGDGPLGRIVAEATASGALRGYVRHPGLHLPLNDQGKLDVGGAVGKGSLHVTKDLGLREPYRGAVPLISGEIGEDIAYYLQKSEQTPSAVAVGVLIDADSSVRAAGGIIVQLMPGADKEVGLVDALEARLGSMPAISRAIDEGARPVDLLSEVLAGFDPEVVGAKGLVFRCACSKERFGRGLVALGKDELEEIIASQGNAELVCHFCSAKYHFDEEELRALVDEIEHPSP